VTSLVAVFEAAIEKNQCIITTKQIVIKNKKEKKKMWKCKNLKNKSPSKRADARESADIIYHM